MAELSETRVSTEVDGLPLSLSNLDKPLFPSGFTKGELIAYYVEIADVMLPHLADRAITRVRFPNGTGEASFYEKNVPAGAPEWVETKQVATSSEPITYVTASRLRMTAKSWCASARSYVALVLVLRLAASRPA